MLSLLAQSGNGGYLILNAQRKIIAPVDLIDRLTLPTGYLIGVEESSSTC